MKFEKSRDLAKWIRQNKPTGETLAVANYVLGHWRLIERAKREGKKIDSRSARFFREASTRLNRLIEARGDAGVSP